MNERPFAGVAEIVGTLAMLETHLEEALEPLGLSLAKFKALHTLVTAGEALPLRTLAEECACVRSNITQLVDRLESDKLVRRVDDPDDRRSLRAQITPLGRERQAAGAKKIEAVRKQLAAALKAIDGAALERALSDLAPISKR